MIEDMTQEEIINALKELKKTKGWKVLREYLQSLYDGCISRLIDKNDLSVEEINVLRAKAGAYKDLIDAPDVFVYWIEQGDASLKGVKSTDAGWRNNN